MQGGCGQVTQTPRVGVWIGPIAKGDLANASELQMHPRSGHSVSSSGTFSHQLARRRNGPRAGQFISACLSQQEAARAPAHGRRGGCGRAVPRTLSGRGNKEPRRSDVRELCGREGKSAGQRGLLLLRGSGRVFICTCLPTRKIYRDGGRDAGNRDCLKETVRRGGQGGTALRTVHALYDVRLLWIQKIKQ